MGPTSCGIVNLFVAALFVSQLIHGDAVTKQNQHKEARKRLRHRKEKLRVSKGTGDFHPNTLLKQNVAPRRQRRMHDVGIKKKPKKWRKLQGNCYSNFNDLRRDMERTNYAEGRTFRICTGEMQARGAPIRLNANDVTVRCVNENRNCRWVNQGLSGRFLAVRGANFAMYDMTINGRGKRTTGNGGCIAIQNSADHLVERTTFRNCYSDANGGAISSNGSLSLRNSDFVNNRANNNNGRGGPAFVRNQARSTSGGSRSSDGEARNCPDGIYFENTGECRKLKNCENGGGNRNPNTGNGNCLNNIDDVRSRLESNASGGTITLCDRVYNVRSTIEVTRTQFRLRCLPSNARSCILRASFSNGPILRIAENVRQSVILDITFENGNNLGDGNGGAIQVKGVNNGINNCLFRNNNANVAGGAIYCDDVSDNTNTRIINNNFESNRAGTGGACHMEPAPQSNGNRGTNNRATRQCAEVFNPRFGTCESLSQIQATARSTPLGYTPRIFNGNEDFVSVDGNLTLSDINGTSVNSNGTLPELNGTLPELNGTLPELNGTLPELNGTSLELNETSSEDYFASSFVPTSTPLFDGIPSSPPSNYPSMQPGVDDEENEDFNDEDDTEDEAGVIYLEPVEYDPR